MATLEERQQASGLAGGTQMGALGEDSQGAGPCPRPFAPAPGKSLRVRVSDPKTGQRSVNVNIPLGLVQFAMKVAARFAPAEVEALDVEQVLAALKAGGPAKLVDVEDEEKGERVEVFVE